MKRVFGWQTHWRSESDCDEPARGQSRGDWTFYTERPHPKLHAWDPKDGELYLNRVKPEETLVEARSDSDVQIDRQI
jgi:hypothetical protein